MVVNEIDQLRLILPHDHHPPIVHPEKNRKDELLDILIESRKKYFQIHPTAENETRQHVVREIQLNSSSDTEARKNELKSTFFSLHENMKEHFDKHKMHLTVAVAYQK